MAEQVSRLSVRVVNRLWLRRVIHMVGDCEAVIDYNGPGTVLRVGSAAEDEALTFHSAGGTVRVDGNEVGDLRRALLSDRYLLGFDLHTPGGFVSAILRVGLVTDFVTRISYFSLAVEGVVLYEEVEGTVVLMRKASDLPLPSQEGPRLGDLPIASPSSDAAPPRSEADPT
jgi:hypothetical protein